MIVFRESTLGNNIFIEYLLVFTNDVLHIPLSLPQRYTSRIVYSRDIEGIQCICVKSHSEKEVQYVTKQGLLHGNGVWIVADDCTPRGAIEDVPNMSTFMSFKIDETAAEVVLCVEKSLCTLQKLQSPLSLYHGTSIDNISSILSTGLQLTNGMMGLAIYLGTIWKAARFAVLGQDYMKRNGSVFRVLCFPSKIATFPRDNWICKCQKCLLNSWASCIVDHFGLWQNDYDCAYVKTTKSEQLGKDGSPKYLLRNDEWAVTSQTFLTHYANINDKYLYGPHYDPKFRNISIS